MSSIARLLTISACVAAVACGDASGADGPAATGPAALRARTAVRLEVADLAKPRMEEDFGLDPYLAPLIYLEAGGAPLAAAPGALLVDERGELVVDPERPTVYFAESTLTVGEEQRRRLTFVWFLALEAPAAQGLRITFDRRGRPAVVEVLSDTSGQRLVFLSDHVDPDVDAALEDPGRSEAPVVVAGRFGVGPMATGPYVYHALGSTDLLSVHCRCQPTQVGETRTTLEYELLPLAALEGLWPEGPATSSEDDPWGPDLAVRVFRMADGS